MVAEAAAVGVADELTGQTVHVFVSLKDNGADQAPADVTKDLVMRIRSSIGPFATPKAIHIVSDLPKTRSGKIMRRILRKLLSGEADSLGDISTVSTMRRVQNLMLTDLPACRPFGDRCNSGQDSREEAMKISTIVIAQLSYISVVGIGAIRKFVLCLAKLCTERCAPDIA